MEKENNITSTSTSKQIDDRQIEFIPVDGAAYDGEFRYNGEKFNAFDEMGRNKKRRLNTSWKEVTDIAHSLVFNTKKDELKGGEKLK